MDNRYIWDVALRQSAIDCNCTPEDFLKTENVITVSRAHPGARKYLPLPFACDMTSYGSNIVAQVSEEARPAVETYLSRVSVSHAFEVPNVHLLDRLLLPYGLQSCYMAEYFLPDVEKLQVFDCPYPVKMMEKGDFDALYLPRWGNALCADRKHLDVLGVGAYDGEELIALAACSADGEEMWQIGIDVLPAYRRQGLAAALTSRLTLEIMNRGKVPFYCAAWCNLASVRNALKCGFRPAWVEMSAGETEKNP